MENFTPLDQSKVTSGTANNVSMLPSFNLTSKRRKLDHQPINNNRLESLSHILNTPSYTVTHHYPQVPNHVPVQILSAEEEERNRRKAQSNAVKKVKERQRRGRMAESIAELRKIVPACKERKLNQALVMSLTVDYIVQLQQQLKRANIENEKLKKGEKIVETELPKVSEESTFTEYQKRKQKEIAESGDLEILAEQARKRTYSNAFSPLYNSRPTVVGSNRNPETILPVPEPVKAFSMINDIEEIGSWPLNHFNHRAANNQVYMHPN
eukprot:TRINITY_DN2463_c0_g1_i1.p1 TRINITY_DN2463_c0_g1~~TRINITY_DN2463_c0_g1_i1.p1  ORF type:complete len:268 (+),score=73.59 TRINITY_DN2463_c0_g1_i1:25-828(+)